jgi:hypothetical protein
MRSHRSAALTRSLPTRAASAVWFHRHRLYAGAALALTVGLFVLAAPWLLTLAVLEHHRTGRKKRLLGLIVLTGLGKAVLWLWREVWRHPFEPHGPWHACKECGYPISNRSRAGFCSPLCRRLARLRTRVNAGDELAQRRLDRLTRDDNHNPDWGEVPF